MVKKNYLVYILNNNMLLKVLSHTVVAYCLVVFIPLLAFATETSFSPALSPLVLIEQATNQVLSEVQTFKQNATQYKKEQQDKILYDIVWNAISPIVDFDLIAKRVMSRHYKVASEEQRKIFAVIFSESLIDTYAKGIVSFSDEEIVFLPYEGSKKKGSRERAKVKMLIKTNSGKEYPISYAMYKNDDQNWKLENLILNGINLGLTFRNQFDQSYQKHLGNIDQVIAGWSSEVTQKE